LASPFSEPNAGSIFKIEPAVSVVSPDYCL